MTGLSLPVMDRDKYRCFRSSGASNAIGKADNLSHPREAVAEPERPLIQRPRLPGGPSHLAPWGHAEFRLREGELQSVHPTLHPVFYARRAQFGFMEHAFAECLNCLRINGLNQHNP
jgi:hypothetical protein